MAPTKTLVIICEDGEGNALQIGERAIELGAPVVWLYDSAFGKTWHIEVDNEQGAPTIKTLDRTLALNDPTFRFYFRSPHFGFNPRLAVPYTILLEWLMTEGYETGSYLTSYQAFDFESCKPWNLLINDSLPIPQTRFGNGQGVWPDRDSHDKYIMKGLSNLRTQAVSLADSALRIPVEGDVHGPVLLQEKISGDDIKVVFYRKATGDWTYLPTVVREPGSLVDYRFADEVKLALFPLDFSWGQFADGIFPKIKSRFFDADFKFTPGGDLVFLEVNFGPSGVSEETTMGLKDRFFSQEMLQDWLAI